VGKVPPPFRFGVPPVCDVVGNAGDGRAAGASGDAALRSSLCGGPAGTGTESTISMPPFSYISANLRTSRTYSSALL
jgi:hypothetical protein